MTKKLNTVVGGRASVCYWTLEAKFLTKAQAVGAVKRLMAEDVDFDVSFAHSHDGAHDVYVVSIKRMAWAANLATVAKILAKVDHKP